MSYGTGSKVRVLNPTPASGKVATVRSYARHNDEYYLEGEGGAFVYRVGKELAAFDQRTFLQEQVKESQKALAEYEAANPKHADVIAGLGVGAVFTWGSFPLTYIKVAEGQYVVKSGGGVMHDGRVQSHERFTDDLPLTVLTEGVKA